MLDREKFVEYHWKQTMALGLIAIGVVAWQVALEDGYIFNREIEGIVKGEAVVEQVEEENNGVIEYQNKIENIVSNYLEQRAKYQKPHQDWLFLINSTKYKILTTSVPEEYKELHVKLVALLDTEYRVVSGSSAEELERINHRWQEIVNQYFWLAD